MSPATTRIEASAAEAKRLHHDEALANGGGIQCGCCFGEEVWVSCVPASHPRCRCQSDSCFSCLPLQEEMFQCSEGHLFCRECATRHAEIKLGDQSAVRVQIALAYLADQSQVILCMDMSGCTSAFPESELSRLLAPKSCELYHRLQQAKELEQAALDGLESCPSCPYAAVIENIEEKLFRCMSEACRQVTCRKCRRRVGRPINRESLLKP